MNKLFIKKIPAGKFARYSDAALSAVNKKVSLLALLLLCIFSLHAQQTIWTGAVNTDWFNTANWSNGIPNATTDLARIDSGTPTCIIGSGQTAVTTSVVINGGTLTIQNSAVLDLDNAVGSGFRCDVSGTFNNFGTLMVDNVTAGNGDIGFGFSNSATSNNFGTILIGTDGVSIEAFFKINIENGIFTNEGILRVEDGGTSLLVNGESTILNNSACGQIIGNGELTMVSGSMLTNTGYLKIKTNNFSQGATPVLTNNGIIEDSQNNLPSYATNNALVIAPISSPTCSDAFANAVQNITPNNFTIATTWYSDATLSTAAGTYNATTNVFTANTGTPLGANTLYFDITDNVNSCSRTVSVEATYNGDNTAPQIDCPTNISVDNDPGVCVANVSYATPLGTDNCPSPTTMQTQGIASGNDFPVGVTTNTFEVTDGTQTADCSFTVTVSDVEDPVLTTCQTDIMTNTIAGNCEAVVTFDPPTATDNCTIGVQGMLATNYDANNGQRGVMFDIAAVNTLTISKFDANLYAGTTANYEIYYKAGTFQGSENNAGAWTFVGGVTALTSLGNNIPTPLPIPVNVTIPAGETYGFYITNDFGGGTSYTDINSATNSLASNADMTITGGIGKSYPFGLTFDFRAFNGTVHYGSNLSVTQTQGGASGSSFSVGTTPVSYLVSDGNGNSVNCDFDVIVNDNEAPQITCPANVSVNTDASNCNAIVSYVAPVGTDNCTPTTTQTAGLASGAEFPVGTTVNTYEVTDGTQTADCSFNVVVTDNEAPQITCPANVSVNTDASNCNAIVTYVAPVGTDNCTPTTTQTAGLASGAEFPVGTTVNTYEVTDGTQTVDCSFNVVVTDNEAPQIACPSNINANTDAGNTTAIVSYTAPVGTDNCTPTTTQIAGLASGATYPLGTTVNTFEVTDGNLTTDCSFNVVVTDNQSPQITCPSNINVSTDAGNCNAVVNYTAPVGTDNGTPTTTQTAGLASGSTYGIGTTTHTFEVTDGNLTADCSFNIIVADNEAPQITCPADINVNNDAGNCTAVVNYTAPIGTDNCTPTTTQTAGLASGSTYGIGTTTHTFEVTDGNLTADCSFNIIVADNEAPQITCPADMNVNTDIGNCTAVVNYTAPIGTDNCTPTTTQTAGFASGSTYGIGTTTHTFEVTDGNLTADCSFNIVVADNEAPQITCPADMNVNTDAGNCTAVVNYTAPIGTDNCTPTTTQTAGMASGASFPTGTTVNTFEVTDGTQTADCSFSIIVTDNEDPMAICQNIDVQLNANNSATLSAAQINGGSTDNCSVSVSIPTTTFDCSDVETPQSVTLTATDSNNNTHTCTATVTVLDDTNPCCPFTDRVYVDIDATGNNDGTTWANAFNDLQNALDEACPTTTEIWVAEGTYLPTETVRVNQTNNRRKSFHWNRNLQIYGGFTGTETMRSERDPAANASILSGNIGAPEIGDNSYHVIVFNGANASVLDGFTVEGGRANAALAYQYGGGQVLDNYGSGIITHSAALTVRNCIIQNNFTGQLGGGIAVWNNTLTVDKTIFRNNTAGAGGGIATNFGTINVSNSLFESNAGGASGGGISVRFSGNLNAVNVTFDKNTSNNGQAIYSEGTSTSNLTNCIIRDFTKRAGNGTINIKNSNVLGSNGSGATWNINRGNDLGGNIDTNPLFTDAANSDYTLIECSPSINTGDNAANATTEDLAGNQRVFETMIDMGAYEFQSIKGDFTNPMALCQNITVQLDADGNGSTTAEDVNNGSNDVCGTVYLSLSQMTFTCPNVGTNTVTLTVTDDSNNTSTCDAIVTVEDNENPAALCQDVTVQLDVDGNGSTTAATVNNCSNDACGIASLSLNKTDFVCGEVGTNTVTLTVTDNNGNESTCDATVTVEDNENPAALCQDVTVQLDVDGNGSTTAAAVNNGSNDVCGEVTLSLSQTNFDCSSPGSNAVTLTVTDESNNTSTCDATVTVEDNIAPVAICPSAPTIQLGSDGVGFILDNGLTNGTSTDNCSVTQSSSFAIFGCEDVGIPQTVVLTATDGSGNIGTADCTVNVIDVTAPAIPTYEVILELDETGNASITAEELGAGSTDACGVGTMEITGGSLDPDAATFGCNSVGETTVELTVTDINGNSRVREISVTVIDPIPAEIECRQPVSTTVTPGMCERMDLTVLEPFVLSDNCGIGSGISISRTPAINDFPIGTTVLIWTVTDSNGNDATCESLVIIEDNEAPILNNYTTLIEFLEPNTCLAQVTINVNATDNCGDVSIVGGGVLSLPFGIHNETITIMDENGNTTEEEITIYVHDDQAPELVMCPENIEIVANQGENAIDLPEPLFTDNCGFDDLTNDAPELFTEGTTTVTWTAEDTYGNTTDCSYDVTITPSIFFTGTASPIEASTEEEEESSMVTWNRPEAITHCEACLITDIPDFIFLGEFEGHQYFLYPNAASWTDAVVLSEEINAQLVTINDVRENEFIQTQLPATIEGEEEVQYWTGLSYQNYDFSWLTNAAFDYVNFVFDPVLNFDVINAGAINADGTWAMMTADMENGFLAERPCLDVKQIAPIIETEGEDGEIIETLLTPDTDWVEGEYTVIYEATDMCDSTATFSFDVTVQEPTAVYCQISGLDQEVWLDRVVFNDYLNESENNAGYADYTEEAVELLGENPLSIQLIPGGINLEENETLLYWRIFVDWNTDGDFFDAGEILHEQTSVNVVNLDLPAILNEEDLEVRLRIGVAKGEYPEACADYTTGEVEDYLLFFPAIELEEEEGNAAGFSIYPNPAGNNVIIDLTEFAQTAVSFNISDNLGKIQHRQAIDALKQKELQLNLRDFNNGIYFVNIKTSKGELITERLVVAKSYNWSVKK